MTFRALRNVSLYPWRISKIVAAEWEASARCTPEQAELDRYADPGGARGSVPAA
jgi:hypothetical protein